MNDISRYDLIIDCFLCLIDIITISELRRQIYGSPKHKRTFICSATVLILILCAAGLFLTDFHYTMSLFIVPASFFLLPFYPKNFMKKLLFESCLSAILFSFMMILNDITNILPRYQIWIMIYLMIFHIGLWCILSLCHKFCRDIVCDMPLSLWGVFLAIPFSTIVSSALLIPLMNENAFSRPASDIFHLLIQLTFLFINIVLFYFLKRYTRQMQREQEKKLLQQQLHYQEEHYQQLIASGENVRRIRHDMKNHLQTIALLYQEGLTTELQEYITTASDMLKKTEVLVSTGNRAFDAILNIKLSELKEKGISCSPELSIPQNLNLPFSDAVTLLGNLLDNAAASCIQHGMPCRVALSVSYRQNTLFLHMSNPCTAAFPAPYGIGMKNVAEVVEKYSGTLQTEVEERQYVTDVIMYNVKCQM